MYSDKSFFALIPARAGSQRLPGKNKRPLNGKPLFVWTIEAARRSRYLDTVCVSTDDPEIADIAGSAHAEVPFLRPAPLAGDRATSVSVLGHALEYYSLNLGKSFDGIVLLQPTSPLRTAEDIDGAVELLFSTGAQAVISVCPEAHSPVLTMALPEDLSLKAFIDGYETLTVEEKSRAYHRVNGAIYICRTESFMREQSFFPRNGSVAYVMPPERSIDIDTEFDFFLAESLMKKEAGASADRT